MKKGISLVALVITIIVMIILTRTVILTMEDNGIISRAQQAVDLSDISTAQEKVLLEMQDMKINAELAGKTVAQYMRDNNVDLTSKGISYQIIGDLISFLVNDKYNVIVDKNGSISGITTVMGTLGTAMNSTRYGNKINYNVSLAPKNEEEQTTGHLGNGWKIFYEDANYIYIIAEDYLHNSLLPTDLNFSKSSSYPYGAFWQSDSNLTSISSANILAAKAKQFGLSWLEDNNNSINPNARATADLFSDTWTVLFGNGISGITCTTIGSPTLEMWIKSWNANPGTTAKLYSSYNATGYYVGTSNPSNSYVYNLGGDVGYTTEGTSKLYFPHDSSFANSYGYWLASPSASNNTYIVQVDFAGNVGTISGGIGNNPHAIRPVVSILKSLVKVTETSNGSGVWNVSRR